MKLRPKHQIVGSIGEETATKYLESKNFEIIIRNYRKKFGEIDIICKKSSKIHFFEVKTVSRENLVNVIHETNDTFRPEDNVHPWKLQRLSRTIQAYLFQEKLIDTDWQFDVIIVFLDLKAKQARVHILENIIL